MSANPNLETGGMSIDQKRLAIAAALAPYLSDDNLEATLRLWQNKYANQPTFALQGFLSEFCTTAALAAQRTKILQSLIRALSGTDGQPARQDLDSVADRLKAEVKQVPPPRITAAPQMLVFTQLMENLFMLIGGDFSIKTRLFLLENLNQLKLAPLVQRDIHAWLSQQYPIPLTTKVEEDALRQMVNTAYIALCEYIGPIKADQTFGEALNMTERETRQHGYSVKKLL